MFEYENVRIAWLGHDAFRIEAATENRKVVYVDPFKIEAGGAKADIVLITHEHFDHCSIDDLRKIVTANTVLVAHAQSKNELSKLRARELKIIKPGDRLEVGGLTIRAVPAYNLNKFREPGVVFHKKEDGKLGFLITVNGVQIYHAGDTDNIPEMKQLHPDIALLPVSGTYVMTPQEAADAARMLKPRIVIPMHYGTIVGGLPDAETFERLTDCRVVILPREETKAPSFVVSPTRKNIEARISCPEIISYMKLSLYG
jgi:L-ascorbate metabolism protein UlaG (beta-lactamase superfamily)